MRRVLLVCALAGCRGGGGDDPLVCLQDGESPVECEPGEVCHPTNGACITPEELEQCEGLPDEAPCALEGFPRTFCIDGLCVASFCGDGHIGPSETCEEVWTSADSCIDYETWGYEYGDLGCDNLFCRANRNNCGDIGWSAVPFDFGTIYGMHELWFATEQALVTEIKENDDIFWGEVGPTDPHIWYQGVWTTPGQAVAVGFGHPDDAPVKTAFAVWSAWAVQEFSNRRLRAVWGRGEDDIYAVGAVLDPDAPYPDDELGAFAVHFDGDGWTQMAVPAGAGPLEGVWVDATRGYAVGADGLILRLEGDAWVDDASPIADDVGIEPDPRLHAVTGGMQGVFAVGEGGTILRLDGASWTVQASPSTATLEAVSGHHAAGEVVAAGEGGMILHYDGHLWAESITDGVTGDQTLHAAFKESVGGEATYFDYEGRDFGRVLDPALDIDVVAGVGADYRTDRVVAAGGCTLYESTGDGWIIRPFPACMPCDAPLVAAWADLDEAFVVSAEGHVLHERAGGWTCDELPVVSARFTDVWAAAPDDVYLVGESLDDTGPRLLRYDGATWTDLSAAMSGLGTGFSAVWGSSGDDVWIVGAGGAIAHFDGATWLPYRAGVDADLVAIDGSAADHVVAVGEAGTIVRFNGVAWAPMTSRTTDDLSEVIAVDDGDVFAVGPGTLHHLNVWDVWSPVRLPDGAVLVDAWGVKGRLYLATESAGLMRLQNVLW